MKLSACVRNFCIVACVLVLLGAEARSTGQEKIAVTTTSQEALREFLEGRRLVDNLRLTSSNAYFQRAVAKDSTFALAYLYLAQSAATAKDFFSNLDRAAVLASRATKGEQLWISGFREGAYANPEGQRTAYQKLVAEFPSDERAHTLMGTHFFAQQDYANAAVYLSKAVEMSPLFAPAYNLLGYAYRFLGRYADAEIIFRKYTDLIPHDPNPYDSYAELLLKMGRYDEAIAQYRKALVVDSLFANSRAGISAALTYQEKHGDARVELQRAYALARNDGERRAALFATAITWADEGKFDKAMEELDKQLQIAQNIRDAGAQAGDLIAMGNVLLEMNRPETAGERFAGARAQILNSTLDRQVKENAKLIYHYNMGRAYLAMASMDSAKRESAIFRNGASGMKNANFDRLAHELSGMIALAEKRYDEAIAELQMANQQDSYNLYRLALAYRAQGKSAEARKACTAAAMFNPLPFLNHAFIRQRSAGMLSAL